MDLESFPKEYLLSSTPLQSPEDSGYFGSGHRKHKSNAKFLNSCSPIKESTYKNITEKYEFCEPIIPQIKFETKLDSANDSLSGIEVNELSEREFISSDFSSQYEFYRTSPSLLKEKKIRNSCKANRSGDNSFNSILKDCDIKYNLFECDLKGSSDLKYSKYLNSDLSTSEGYTSLRNARTFKPLKIDFIHELNKRNCFSINSCILSNLSAKELCIASCVSKEWNKVILHDFKANSRRKNLITERNIFLNGPLKENRKGMKYGPAKEHKQAFSDLTNTNTVFQPVNVKVLHTKFDSFIKEAKITKSTLLKCPRCSNASRCIDGNNYICTSCSYKFCSHCLDPIFKNHTCFKLSNKQLPNIVVGSKKSKRNLKRL